MRLPNGDGIDSRLSSDDSLSQTTKGMRAERIIHGYARMAGATIQLVASASYPFAAVQSALAVPVWSFPAEGTRYHRCLPAHGSLDQLEDDSEAAVLRLFGLSADDYAVTTQPHSVTQANQIVFKTLLRPGQRVLALHPDAGGHISHTVDQNSPFQIDHYGLDESGHLSLTQLEDLARHHQPRLIIVGGSCYPHAIDLQAVRQICDRYGAYLMYDMAHTASYVASGRHPAVFPHADVASFTLSKTLRGPEGGLLIVRRSLKAAVDAAVFPGVQGGPLVNHMLAKLVALEQWTQQSLGEFSDRVVANANRLLLALRDQGLQTTTTQTATHLLLLDCRDHRLPGAELEAMLEQHGILASRNRVPADPLPANACSGIRLGVTAITQLGYDTAAITQLAQALSQLIHGDRQRGQALVDQLIDQHRQQLADLWQPAVVAETGYSGA
ncbi:MAG: serine hydroxymethyltransferase [Wenzhouxiangellaceae bacterium]